MQLVAGMEDDLQYTRATLQRMKAAEQAGQAVRSKGVSLAEELGLGQKEVEEGEKKQEPDPPLPQKQPEPVVEEKVVVVEKLVEVEKLVPGPAPDPVIVYVPQEEDPAEAEQRRQKLLHEAKAGLRSALEADFRREIELLAVYKGVPNVLVYILGIFLFLFFSPQAIKFLVILYNFVYFHVDLCDFWNKYEMLDAFRSHSALIDCGGCCDIFVHLMCF
mgnify:CR=1 FL=1